MLGTLKKIFAFAGDRKGLLKKSLFFSFLNGIFASFQFGRALLHCRRFSFG